MNAAMVATWQLTSTTLGDEIKMKIIWKAFKECLRSFTQIYIPVSSIH